MKYKLFVLILAVVLGISACKKSSSPSSSTAATPAQANPQILKVMTHDSFAASETVIAGFEKANNAKVQIITSGDAGTALNKAILSKDNPIADVFYGVDNTFLNRAISEGIYEPYVSPVLKDIPEQYKLDTQNRALPVDWGDVCLNYDKKYFSDHNLPPPQNLDDLLKPVYKGLLVVENPATSSPGLAFLLATIGHYGANQYIDYWHGLKVNNVLIVNDWNTAYYTNFSRNGGDRPIVVSYGSSPPFEVIESKDPNTAPNSAAITSDGSCFRQIEFVGILKGTKNLDLAQKWVDFMLSTKFQEDMPLQMYVFPVNSKAKLNATFQKYLSIPEKPVVVSPEEIAANRDKWIKDWTDAILR